MGARGGRRGREVVAATGDGIGGAGRRGIGPLPDPEPAERGGRWEGGLRRRALGGGGDGERRRGDGDGPIRSGSDERERRGSGEVVAVVGSGGVRVSGQGGGVAYRPGDWARPVGPVGWSSGGLWPAGPKPSGGGCFLSFFSFVFCFLFFIYFLLISVL